MLKDFPHARACLTYLSFVCETIREEMPFLYDEILFGKLDYFVDTLDDRETLDHLTPMEQESFIKELDEWCLTMQRRIELVMFPSTSIH